MSARKATVEQPAANLPRDKASRCAARAMAALAPPVREHLLDNLTSGCDEVLFAAHSSLAAALAREVTVVETADILAQAAVSAAPIIAAASVNRRPALQWLLEQATAWECVAIQQAEALSTQYLVLSADRGYPAPPRSKNPSVPLSPPLSLSPAHDYELFLRYYAPQQRKRRGVFFTPQPIADYIVVQIDAILHDECGLPEGLATQSAIRNPQSAIPFILDPAAGTGVFLLAAIDRIHRTLTDQWKQSAAAPADIHGRWNSYVPGLLERLWGIEILPAPALLAKLNIALKLAETGYSFNQPHKINIVLGDALTPAAHSVIRNPQSAIPIILGNPPFSSLSTNTNDWITRLVRGDDEIRGYVQANGQRLGERKTWLHDDYVKFIRLAQWHVEQAGCGIVGFVTNHGYLDNATFRLMRQELLRVFPRVRIVDLHGNRKKHEAAPDGSRDENVFGLDQGLAISLFCRPPTPTRSVSEGRPPQTRSASEGSPPQTRSASEGIAAPIPSRVEYAELWGSRESKLHALDMVPRSEPALALRTSVLTPHPPQWRLIPLPPSRSLREYDSAWSLADAMPVNATAPVTARDHFVVAATEPELCQRIAELRDLSIPDEEIRRRYFTRTRSARYVSGDTRGWKLAAARRAVAADNDWRRHILRCLYRPFDWRFVFWHPAMIDWPRTPVTRHLIEGSGFRVQGSESRDQTLQMRARDAHSGCQALGTKYSVLSTKYDDVTHQADAPFAPPEPRTLNPEPSCLCLIARRQQLPSQPCTFFWIADCLPLDGVIRSDNRGSESLFPLYLRELDANGRSSWRANFAPDFVHEVCRRLGLAWLPLGRGDLERTLGPQDLLNFTYALFHAPSYRERYADALREDFPRVLLPRDAALFKQMCSFGSELAALHAAVRGSPDPAPLTTEGLLASPEVTNFRVGGYVVLRKWLQPPHRSADDPEYHRVAAAIGQTIKIMGNIDAAISRAGSWPAAFQSA